MYGAPRFATPWSSQPLLFLASVHSLLILPLVTRALYSAIGSSICQSIRSRARRDSDASPETTKRLCQILLYFELCFPSFPFFSYFFHRTCGQILITPARTWDAWVPADISRRKLRERERERQAQTRPR